MKPPIKPTADVFAEAVARAKSGLSARNQARKQRHRKASSSPVPVRRPLHETAHVPHHPMTDGIPIAPDGTVTKRDSAAGAVQGPITLTVAMPPTLTNSGAGRSRHWRSVEREKAAYWQQLDNAQLLGHIAAPPLCPIERVTVRSSMVLRGAMDDDNAAARHKWLLDWLRTRGYIASDRRSHCRWESFPEQRVSRKEPATITITLSPTSEVHRP